MHRKIACSLLLVSLSGVACRPVSTIDGVPGSDTTGPGKPTVFVVNYPLEFFASRIGGDLVQVEFPVPRGEDPAFWKPSEVDLTRVQKADVILLNGAGYAKWTRQVSLPDSRVVDTSRLYNDRLIHVDGGVVHTHGPGGEHSHGGLAFTTWLDPQLAMLQAEAVYQALAKVLPEDAPALEQNHRQLQEELAQLDQQLEAVAERYQGEPLLASHPVYQYLTRRCGWNLRSLHWEPDDALSAGQWEEFTALHPTHPSKWMLWEATPDHETAEKLAAAGVTSVVFEPCGNRPDSGYLEVMTANIQRLMTIFPE